MRNAILIGGACCAVLCCVVWFVFAANPTSPAGYVGYLTQGAVFGQAKYCGLQTGPTSPGRTWLLSVTNVSVTPYTNTEEFAGESSVLSRDNLKIGFRVHVVWRVRADKVRELVEQYSTLNSSGTNSTDDMITDIAYANYIREPLRTYARDEIQRLDGLLIKEQITPIGLAIMERIKTLTTGTPFDISSVVVGNIQYPAEVADAVAKKMAMTQVLEQKATELLIEEQSAAMRIVQAEGIAKAMEIIQSKLTDQYLQHEAIEAQKAMVGSQNHTVIYIPVGNMGVPLVGTVDAKK